jgi:HK97 family phage major capsid protein
MNHASRTLVDHHLSEVRRLARIDEQRDDDDVQSLSIGRAMQCAVANAPSMSFLNLGRDTAKAEFRRSDRNALILPDHLKGTGKLFAAMPGARDCLLIDWAWLRAEASRAMATGVPDSKGGYLVPVNTLATVDPVWWDSLIGVAGVQQINLSANALIPRGTGAVTIQYQGTDGATTTAQDETLGSVSITQKTLLANLQVSYQLLRQANAQVYDYLSRLLLRKVRSAFDTMLLQGSGASGQPQGLANLPTASGITQVSGSSLAWAGILSAQKYASAAGVRDSKMFWVGAPTVRETLGARERATGGGRFLWDSDGIAGQPALSTPDAPAATLFCGDFSSAILALFGAGIEIRFDPNNVPNSATAAFQVLAMFDIVFPQASAFVRVTSIS